MVAEEGGDVRNAEEWRKSLKTAAVNKSEIVGEGANLGGDFPVSLREKHRAEETGG
jgi:hypothetical protein